MKICMCIIVSMYINKVSQNYILIRPKYRKTSELSLWPNDARVED